MSDASRPVPPPRPVLDAGRADAARAKLAALLGPALAELAAGPLDGYADAGCRLVAGILGDVAAAWRARSAAAIERHVREFEGLAGRLPERLAECRQPATWQAEDREAVRPDPPKKKRWGRK